MADERIIHRMQTYGREGTLDGNVLTLRRMVNTREAQLFEWLVDPARAAQWTPCVPEARIDQVGPTRLREHPGDEPLGCQVTGMRAPHQLSHTWGQDALAWTVAGHGLVPSLSPSALLTLRHSLAEPASAGVVAAAWHLCISVLDLRVAGMDVPRVIGPDAAEYGLDTLSAEFERRFGLA